MVYGNNESAQRYLATDFDPDDSPMLQPPTISQSRMINMHPDEPMVIQPSLNFDKRIEYHETPG